LTARLARQAVSLVLGALIASAWTAGDARQAGIVERLRQAKIRLQAARRQLEKLRGLPLSKLGPPWQREMKQTLKIYGELMRIHGSENHPHSDRAACLAGVALSLLCEAAHASFVQARVPEVVRRLGPAAVAIYAEKVRERVVEEVGPLEARAEQHLSECLRAQSCSSDHPVARVHLRRLVGREPYYAGPASQPFASQPATHPARLPSRPRRDPSWWYTRCRALNIVTDAYRPPLKQCISLVVAEVRRLTRQADRRTAFGEWSLAVAAYSRALKLDPDFAAARRGRALANGARGRLSDALSDIRWWRERNAGTRDQDSLELELQRAERERGSKKR